MPSVYILLTRTDTLFVKALHGATRSRYTHVSLALDRGLERMYSFARRREAMPLPAGFVQESRSGQPAAGIAGERKGVPQD